MTHPQDDIISESSSTKNGSSIAEEKPRHITHQYVEIGGELLAKPQALCDILEVEGFPTALIYCNSPSDTDLVEVLLKKKGISASKLIGHVPPVKVQQALERITNKEISALVVTDIAARTLTLQSFPVVIQYSLQDDPDVYKDRLHISSSDQPTSDGSSADAAQQRVITLVSPLDVANFHSIRKYLGFEFQERKLPAPEDLLRSRVQNLARRSQERGLDKNPQTKTLVQLLLECPDKEDAIALLVHNTFEVLPQITSELEKAHEREFIDDSSYNLGSRGDSGERGGNRDRGEGGRGGRGGPGNGRGGRGSSRGSRDGSDSRRQGGGRQGGRSSRGWEPGDEIDDSYADERVSARDRDGDDDYGDSQGERSRHGEGSQSRQREPVQRIKEERVYFGVGSSGGFSQDLLTKLLDEHCGLGQDSIKRFSLRSNYAFADFAEETAPQILEKLANSNLPGGKSLFVTKAITLSTTVPAASGEGTQNSGSANGNYDSESAESQDYPEMQDEMPLSAEEG